MKLKKLGFTLVELIITITILAILATIAFINFGNYTSQSRDSLRLADLKNIEKALTFNKIETGVFPEPENAEAPAEINGIDGIKWKKGKFGETQYLAVKKLNKLPKDPNTNQNYDYYVSENGRFFRLESQKEENGEKIVLSNYVVGETDSNSSEQPTNNPSEKVVKNTTSTFTEVTDNPLGNVNRYYIQSETNLKWDSEKQSKKWANGRYKEPVWNGNTYEFPDGKTAGDYPAFKYCMDKGSKWRLPTRNELLSIVNYAGTNSNGAYSNLPTITDNWFWSSTNYDHYGIDGNYAWNVNFDSGYSTSYYIKYYYNGSVVCVHN